MRSIPGLLIGDVLEKLAEIPERSVNCAATSPPYYGLRDYGVPPSSWDPVEYRPMPGLPPVCVPAMEACLGLEPSPEAYIGHLVAVFRAVRRVLRDDGVAWLNLGDSFTAGQMTGGTKSIDGGRKSRARMFNADMSTGVPSGNLLGIPWRAAFALQADGWTLRSEVIWHKPNPMPESVTNRPTKAHEQVFLLAKGEGYWYDAEAVRETSRPESAQRYRLPVGRRAFTGTRNRRSVWTIPVVPFAGDHFAPFPPELARICILAGCPEGGTVLDPFHGTGTVAIEAEKQGKRWLGIDLDPAAVDHMYRRAFTVQKRGEA